MAMREQEAAATPDPPRDPVLDRVYAAGARPEPPAHVDAAILAAARRQVHAGPRRPDSILRRWRGPFALAAVLVLSVTVVLLMREEGADRLAESPALPRAPASATDDRGSVKAEEAQPEAPRARPDTSARRTPQSDSDFGLRDAPAHPAAPAEQDRRKEQAAPESEPKQEAPRSPESPPFSRSAGSATGAKRAPSQALPPPTDALAKQTEESAAAGVRGLERAEPERQAATPAPAPPPAAAAPDSAVGAIAPPPARSMARQSARESTPDARERQRNDVAAAARPVWQGYEGQPPEKWLERVAELRRAGRDAEAREMLAEFRRRFPNAPVPATLDR